MTTEKEEGGSEIPEKLSPIIPELFYDVIVRMVPGAVILFLYWKQINPLFPEMGSGAKVAWVILAGYVVGFAMNALTLFPIAGYFAYLLLNGGKGPQAGGPGWRERFLEPDAAFIFAQRPYERRILTKTFAEKGFCRIVSGIALAVAIFPPETLQYRAARVASFVIFVSLVLYWFNLQYGVKRFERNGTVRTGSHRTGLDRVEIS